MKNIPRSLELSRIFSQYAGYKRIRLVNASTLAPVSDTIELRPILSSGSRYFIGFSFPGDRYDEKGYLLIDEDSLTRIESDDQFSPVLNKIYRQENHHIGTRRYSRRKTRNRMQHIARILRKHGYSVHIRPFKKQ